MTYSFHHIHLVCSSLEQMMSFFLDLLGANFIELTKFGDADGARLNLDGVIINLRASREGEENLENASRTRYGYDHIGLEVEDMEAAFKKLTNRGIHFINPPREKGNKITAFFNWPDNISVELIQPLN